MSLCGRFVTMLREFTQYFSVRSKEPDMNAPEVSNTPAAAVRFQFSRTGPKLFVYVSIPLLFATGGLMCGISLNPNATGTIKNCTDLAMGREVIASLDIRYPLFESYIHSITLQIKSKPAEEISFTGAHICLMKTFLQHCHEHDTCVYKQFNRSELAALSKAFDQLVLC